uniref:Uncharacterized protein n=1 Tax=Arundo donax TaxID=35708 RepID=A0A0A9E924_ARUDO
MFNYSFAHSLLGWISSRRVYLFAQCDYAVDPRVVIFAQCDYAVDPRVVN